MRVTHDELGSLIVEGHGNRTAQGRAAASKGELLGCVHRNRLMSPARTSKLVLGCKNRWIDLNDELKLTFATGISLDQSLAQHAFCG